MIDLIMFNAKFGYKVPRATWYRADIDTRKTYIVVIRTAVHSEIQRIVFHLAAILQHGNRSLPPASLALALGRPGDGYVDRSHVTRLPNTAEIRTLVSFAVLQPSNNAMIPVRRNSARNDRTFPCWSQRDPFHGCSRPSSFSDDQ